MTAGIVEKPIAELLPYINNSRTHTEHQIDQVAASIREFGFLNPVLIDKDGMIIAGHCRVAALRKLNLQSVPCIVADHLTPLQVEAYVIADNKLAENAGWDEDLLRIELQKLQEQGFDIDLLGFDETELNALFNEIEIDLKDADEVPELPEEPITKLGDLWILGDHRLLCGDSTLASDVERLLNGQHPNTMITDPPYGVKLDMSWRDKARTGGNNNSNTIKNDDRADWYDTYSLFPGAIAYVWHASAFTDVVMDGLRRAGFEVKQQIIWNKPALVMGRSHYHWKHEPCWYAVRKGSTASWKGDRKQTTVWDIASPNASGGKRSEDDKTEHPTQKPVELYMRSILHHTNAGEYIYDPFGGSGTLVIACEKSKRRALTIDLDPKYCDVIVQRWEKLTGNKAVLEDRN